MKKYFSLIKFSHTIFALPFALLGYFLGIHEQGFGFDIKILLLVLLCMVFARSAAMAFNRYVDRNIDAKNERTAIREIPSGLVSAKNALLFTIISSLLFICCTWFINRICFYLSPVTLVVILGYSYTKRFTLLCHFVLGVGLALAPIGAFLAVTGYFATLPILYGCVVLFWVSGFDVIYALQDEDFDARNALHSVPQAFGKLSAMNISNGLHIVSGIILVIASMIVSQNHDQLLWLHWIGSALFICLLIYQHMIISPKDLSKVNLAFFTTNGFASLLFAGFLIADFYL